MIRIILDLEVILRIVHDVINSHLNAGDNSCKIAEAFLYLNI